MKDDEVIIVFSLDADWVSDEILEWAIGLFKNEGWPVTVFATNASEVLRRSHNDPYVDISIHPDFFQNNDHEKTILELIKLFPDSKGVRSHGLFEYANLLNLYRKHGLSWDSSQLLYLCRNIMPYRHPSGLIRLPIFWEDDDYFSDNPDWRVERLGLEKSGVKCFDFHPIHLFLNTYIASQYTYAKERHFSHQALDDARYNGNDKGIYNFFIHLSEYIRQHSLKVSRMEEVCSWV